MAVLREDTELNADFYFCLLQRDQHHTLLRPHLQEKSLIPPFVWSHWGKPCLISHWCALAFPLCWGFQTPRYQEILRAGVNLKTCLDFTGFVWDLVSFWDKSIKVQSPTRTRQSTPWGSCSWRSPRQAAKQLPWYLGFILPFLSLTVALTLYYPACGILNPKYTELCSYYNIYF